MRVRVDCSPQVASPCHSFAAQSNWSHSYGQFIPLPSSSHAGVGLGMGVGSGVGSDGGGVGVGVDGVGVAGVGVGDVGVGVDGVGVGQTPVVSHPVCSLGPLRIGSGRRMTTDGSDEDCAHDGAETIAVVAISARRMPRATAEDE